MDEKENPGWYFVGYSVRIHVKGRENFGSYLSNAVHN